MKNFQSNFRFLVILIQSIDLASVLCLAIILFGTTCLSQCWSDILYSDNCCSENARPENTCGANYSILLKARRDEIIYNSITLPNLEFVPRLTAIMRL